MREGQRRLRGVDAAVIVIVLDDFKAVDDPRSFEDGDRVLREVAARLRAQFGHRAIVGRLDGYEFGIVTRMNRRAMQGSVRAVLSLIGEPIGSAPPAAGADQTSHGQSWTRARRRASSASLSAALTSAGLLAGEARGLGRHRARTHVASAGEVNLEGARRRGRGLKAHRLAHAAAKSGHTTLVRQRADERLEAPHGAARKGTRMEHVIAAASAGQYGTTGFSHDLEAIVWLVLLVLRAGRYSRWKYWAGVSLAVGVITLGAGDPVAGEVIADRLLVPPVVFWIRGRRRARKALENGREDPGHSA